MQQKNQEKWLEDFIEFSHTDEKNVPEELFGKIKARLFPNPWFVFGKVTILHLVVGFLSLGVCHQFGLNPFQTNFSLTNWFMKIGNHQFCMVLCGVLFMSTTYILANFFLTLEEFETVRRFEWLQLGIFGIVSLAAFYFFGAELVTTFTLLWLAGAFVGGFLAIEGTYRFRRGLQN